MKVKDLIELLKTKPQELNIELQYSEYPTYPSERVVSMCSLDKSNIAVMRNGDTVYLAIGCTADGIARADNSPVRNIDKDVFNYEYLKKDE